MDPAIVPWDTRFARFTKSVERWNGLDASLEIVPGVEYFLVFGGLDPIDLRHAARFGAAPNVSIYFIEKTGHHVAARLGERGVLKGLTDALVNADDPRRGVSDVLREESAVAVLLERPEWHRADDLFRGSIRG
jgi:hypothetical protein